MTLLIFTGICNKNKKSISNDLIFLVVRVRTRMHLLAFNIFIFITTAFLKICFTDFNIFSNETCYLMGEAKK